MPDLTFSVEGAEAVPFSAAPTIAFKLRIVNADPQESIHSILLRSQIQLEVARRRYTPAEQSEMVDLFGDPERWSQTLRTMLWTHASTVVPTFTGCIMVDLLVPCTFDFNVAATKYFHGLDAGDIPLLLQFSGTAFYAGEDAALRVAPISWDKEARFRLPLHTWKAMMDAYYPNSVPLSVRKDIFERLHHFKMSRGIATWEQAFERLLDTP